MRLFKWGGAETHLSEEHREDSQADPVNDAGKLEGIVNCNEQTKELVIHVKRCATLKH